MHTDKLQAFLVHRNYTAEFSLAAEDNLHPDRIARIHCPRFVSRVGLPRSLCLIGSLTAALRFVQGLGPKRRESWIANWVYFGPRGSPSLVVKVCPSAMAGEVSCSLTAGPETQ